MGISDVIADFINEMLQSTDGTAELQRADLANRFNCVPSQINYVISTRFSPERGFIVESRRGGGGYIRIRRVQSDPAQLIMHTVNAVGDGLDLNTAAALLSNLLDNEAITAAAAKLMMAAISDTALRAISPYDRDLIRAGIFKQMLLHTL